MSATSTILRVGLIAITCLVTFCGAIVCHAQDNPGMVAALSAYQQAETERRLNISVQYDLVNRLRYAAMVPGDSFSMWGDGPGYAPIVGGGPGLRFLRPMGAPTPWPYGAEGAAFFGPIGSSAEEQAPFLALAGARQPIGFWSGQTGPDQWEYHPIYAQPPRTWVSNRSTRQSALSNSTPGNNRRAGAARADAVANENRARDLFNERQAWPAHGAVPQLDRAPPSANGAQVTAPQPNRPVREAPRVVEVLDL